MGEGWRGTNGKRGSADLDGERHFANHRHKGSVFATFGVPKHLFYQLREDMFVKWGCFGWSPRLQRVGFKVGLRLGVSLGD